MHPPVFSDLSFDDALAKASADEKILLVDASASWCQPCKHMDKTTWVDGKVVNAIGERAVAIQFDVDEQKELAKKLAVRAMPTVIAFRDGKEIDRIVGMRGPAPFVAWLEALARGETSLDTARKTARDDPTNIEARLTLSRALIEANALDEATTEHVWIWEHAIEHAPSMIGVKHSFFLHQVTDLCAQHAPAREAFARIRDASKPGTMDWLSLNKALGEESKTLAWWEGVEDRVKDDEELAKVAENVVVPILVAAGRWPEAGKAYANPVKVVERLAAFRKEASEHVAKQVPADQRDAVLAHFEKKFIADLGTMRRALYEAGRDDDLRAVDEAAKAVDPAWVVPLPK